MSCNYIFSNIDDATDFIIKLQEYFKTHESISSNFISKIIDDYYNKCAIDEPGMLNKPEEIINKPVLIEIISIGPSLHGVCIREDLQLSPLDIKRNNHECNNIASRYGSLAHHLALIDSITKELKDKSIDDILK